MSTGDYNDLWNWSTTDLNAFWMLVWEFTRVRAQVSPTFAISPSESKRLTPVPAWFPEARLNFAQNILDSAYAEGRLHETVLTGIREGGSEIDHLTLHDLRTRVARLSNALRDAGVQQGDRVACIGANSITTFVVFLAAAAIGAPFTSCSPETGEKGILDRFLQVRPRVLFADDGVLYNNKRINCLAKVKQVAVHLKQHAGLDSLVIIPRFPIESTASPQEDSTYTLEQYTAQASGCLSFAELPFGHPLLIVYSSGTTGQPKCIVHTTGGVLLKQKVEQILCVDMGPASVHLQYTTVSSSSPLRRQSGYITYHHASRQTGSCICMRSQVSSAVRATSSTMDHRLNQASADSWTY